MTTRYDDPLLTIADGVLTICRYFLPIGGSKRIGLGTIRSADERRLGRLSGRWRLWGTSSPSYWLNQDFGRHRKDIALVLDVGKRVKPLSRPTTPRPSGRRSRTPAFGPRRRPGSRRRRRTDGALCGDPPIGGSPAPPAAPGRASRRSSPRTIVRAARARDLLCMCEQARSRSSAVSARTAVAPQERAART